VYASPFATGLDRVKAWTWKIIESVILQATEENLWRLVMQGTAVQHSLLSTPN
jgi:hypothetical protein